MKKLLSRVAAGTVASIAAFAGFSTTVVGASAYSNDGWRKPHRSWSSSYTKTVVDNFNDIEVENEVEQKAESGDVNVGGAGGDYNTLRSNGWKHHRSHYRTPEVGNVTSGGAYNDSSFNANVSVSNTASSTSATSSVAPSNGSGATYTRDVQKTYVTNTNLIEVENEVEQEAESGDVYVGGNLNVGNVSSGDASNSSSSSVTVSVSN